jgi:LysR family transcriptional regulator, regulator for metE and metH
MYLELRHLRALLAITESGTLAQAAAKLNVTQSALSHLLKGLEDYFETPLFFRGARPMRATPSGEQLLQLARGCLPSIEHAERQLKMRDKRDVGRLNITLECHSCFDWLIPAMDRYREHWPKIDMDLSLAYSFEPLPALRRGEVDLVITSDPVADMAAYVPLFDYQSVLAVAPTHRLASRKFVQPSDLASEVMITYPVCRTRLDVFAHFLRPAGVEPKDHRRAELTAIILQLVANQKGVAALPEWAVAASRDIGRVATVTLGKKGLWRRLYAAVRDEDAQQAYLQTFVDTVRRVATATLVEAKAL